MKTKIKTGKGAISLIADDESKAVLAECLLFEGTGMWVVIDIRLSRHKQPSEYSCALTADEFCSVFHPSEEGDREYALSKISIYKEMENGDLIWPTFENYHIGPNQINTNGAEWSRGLEFSGYFKKSEALELLQLIKSYWDIIPDIKSNWRIDNPLRQPRADLLESEMRANKILAKYAETTPAKTKARP